MPGSDVYHRDMDDAGAAQQLFERLLHDPAVTQLASLREHTDLHVRSVAENSGRVDVVAGAGDHEWRVVIGSDDMAVAQWVHVFARPPRFDGPVGGRAVILNGPSSAGKSTLLSALRNRVAEPWVVFDEPMFGSVRSEYLIWPERAPLLHDGFLNGIASLASAGNQVAVAAGGLSHERFRQSFVGVPTVWVGLDCPDEERRRREATRRDVPGGHFAASPHIHDGWEYDLWFDTAVVPLDEMVQAIVDRIG
jgi:chloramphenicol 3-O phosphotransferase